MTYDETKTNMADNLSIVLENQAKQIKITCDFSGVNLMEMMYTINNAIVKARMTYEEVLDRERMKCMADDDYRD